jgi:NTE family protein
MNYQFKNLVFEGGGVKGIAYGGALQKLEELKILQNIERVAGTSAGAITATLLAIGYEAKEISDIIANTNFQDFADEDEGYLKDIYRFFVYFGWHKGDKLKQWTSDHLFVKFGKADLTFSELHHHSELSETVSQRRIRDLYIVGSNLTTHKSELYSHETTPDMQIRDAVRISMSIPFYFQAVFSKTKDVLVDGGVIRNYPINIFDDNGYNAETLGFRLFDKNTIEGGNKKLEITGIKSFAMSLITFMQATACNTHINAQDWQRTIAIDTTGVEVTEFDLSQAKKNTLIDNGYKGVDKYLNWLKLFNKESSL